MAISQSAVRVAFFACLFSAFAGLPGIPLSVTCLPLSLAAAQAQAQAPEGPVGGVESAVSRQWIWSKAHPIPAETTSEQSGYFSIVEGRNGRIYVGTAKYGDNAYLVEFDPRTDKMAVVVDAEKEIGVDRRGFAAQAKFHTRNNVGPSGKIYLGTKQGYTQPGEKTSDYLGGHPMVYDPATGKTRVYDIPVKHQGVISVTPDESRGVAYISTCSDERPIESTHFMVLNLETGKYRDLLDCRHMYAFIVVDHLGRAYHPILGGEIARFDPRGDKLDRLKQTIDGAPPDASSLLAHPESHPINWDISPDRKTLYSVAMSGNQLYAYDLTGEGMTLAGRKLGKLIPGAEKTDCRALCVAPDGTVWAGVNATFAGRGDFLHVCSYRPGDPAPIDRGPIAIGNPDYAVFADAAGQTKPHHHGVYRLKDGTLVPRYVVMGICAAGDGTVYVTTLYPFSIHQLRFPRVAGIATTYYHNAHADMFFTRLLRTDSLDNRGAHSPLKLASLFTDQTPANDMGRAIAAEHQVPRFDSARAALQLGGDRLAVDGVLMIAEHGQYPESKTGQFVFPKRRFFTEVASVVERSGRAVPVFCDKHLADNWTDAKWIYEEAKRLRIPLMAGSSLPVTWRDPPLDTTRGGKLREIAVTTYGRLDSYGIHALEAAQTLAERRGGGETGIARVRYLEGPAVWEAAQSGLYDRGLLDAALARLKDHPLPAGKRVEELAGNPGLMVVDYRDGLRVRVFVLEGAVQEWSAAWKEDTGPVQSTLFWTQELRPFQHFTAQLAAVGKFIQTGAAPWPVERTLLTTGALDAILVSKRDGGRIVETPWLQIAYQSAWNWQQTLPPPPGRPITAQ
jgi:sugar lactone lactonase YvrE